MTPADLKLAREQAEILAAGEPAEWGYFLWLEGELFAAGQPSTTKWWSDTLLDFWRTRKRTLFAAVGLRGIKSSTTSRVAVAETLLRPRKAILGASFIWPALAATKPEAAGRVLNIRNILRGLGFRELERKNKGEETGGEIVSAGSYAYSHSGTTGTAIIEFQDAEGNMVAFRAGVANMAAVREYTGIGALFDEWDHVPVIGPNGEKPAWGSAHDILDYGLARLAGQKDAHAYVVSNPTVDTACLSAACRAGDGPETFIARLGEQGARDLEKAFKYLASRLATTDPKLSRDKRFHEEQDPRSWRIPSAIARPITNDGKIDVCEAMVEHWGLACDSSARSGEDDPAGTFFRIYCARSKAGVSSFISQKRLEEVECV